MTERLGRGLDALLGYSGGQVAESNLVEVDPALVEANREQPRRQFDEAALRMLADSIRLNGLLHPIVVERLPGRRYRLIAGERRLRAAQLAGVGPIPALVRPAADSARHALELALTENLVRSDLSPIEEAAAFSRLADTFGLSHESIALRVGRSRPVVSNTIRLLALPATVQTALAAGRISAGHARALLALPSATDQEALATRIEAAGLSVRETEDLVQRGLGRSQAPRARREAAPASADDAALCRGFETIFGQPVRLERNGRRARLVVDVTSDEDLHSLYGRLGGPSL